DFTAAAPYAAMLVLLGAVPVYVLVRHVLRHLEAPKAASATSPVPTQRVEAVPGSRRAELLARSSAG
ncbi:MAG TPA: hypothetical protein VFM41_13160, partial [Gaiella sp.]|nr:hypothetical protein [Gaiella sp.]